MASPRYGIDAPGVIRNLVLAGAVLMVLGLLFPRPLGWAVWSGAFVALGGVAMLASSLWGKQVQRDRLVDGLALRGDERLLDLGCGHGLLLLGAAKRLPRGHADGIDLWSQVDQARNSRDATLQNANLEGVSERVTLHDGDMRTLPFEDQSFDVIVSSLAIHNIPTVEGRAQAVREAARVLKPGGQVALLDFQRTAEYAQVLRDAGLQDVRRSGLSFWMYPPVRVVRGRKP